MCLIGWKQFITNCAVVVYTDNDAVRDCLIAPNTSSTNARPILDLHLKVEFQSSFNAWMSRVPIDSNMADAPSRGDCKSLRGIGAAETDVNVEMVWNDVQEFQMSGGGKDQQCSSPQLQKVKSLIILYFFLIYIFGSFFARLCLCALVISGVFAFYTCDDWGWLKLVVLDKCTEMVFWNRCFICPSWALLFFRLKICNTKEN